VKTAASGGVLSAVLAERARVSGLEDKARRGTHAIFATRILAIALTFLSITIIARLVPPADFGIWAMAGLALGLMSIVRELGLLQSVVQAPSLAPGQRDGFFWTSVVASVAAAGLLLLAAPLVAGVYAAPLVQPVIQACCVSLVLNGIGLVHAAVLRRNLEYGKLVVVEGGGMSFGLATGIVFAFLWRDVWSMVAGHIACAAWMAGSAWLLGRWVPRLPDRSTGRIDLSFSLQVTWYNVLTFAGNNVGLAAGYRFGAAELGYFNRGQQLYHAVHYSFLTPITEVGLSLLSRLKPDDTYRAAYVAMARRVFVLFIPYAVLLPLLAEDIIVALLGPDWAPAVPILAWFAPAVLGQACAALLAQLLTSQGRGAELRGWALKDLALRGGGAIAGSAFGIVGLAAGFSLATFLLCLPLMACLVSRSGPVGLRHHFAAMWPGALLALAALLGAVLALAAAHAMALGAGWVRLFTVGAAAALAWALACLALPPARDALLGKGLAHG
jgi:PST family polysaccharide transporter